MTELQARIIRRILEDENAMQIAADFIKKEEEGSNEPPDMSTRCFYGIPMATRPYKQTALLAGGSI